MRFEENDRRTAQLASSAIALLQGKWTASILFAMARGPLRTSELLRRFPLASKKIVIESLRNLETRGLVRRQYLSLSLRHVQYQLSEELLLETIDLLQALARWSSLLPNAEQQNPEEDSANGSSSRAKSGGLPAKPLLHTGSSDGPGSGL